eukprot:2907467-Amphidinium_carterae.1
MARGWPAGTASDDCLPGQMEQPGHVAEAGVQAQSEEANWTSWKSPPEAERALGVHSRHSLTRDVPRDLAKSLDWKTGLT